MSVFEYKDGFRPRDQSVSTKLKYETEAKLWLDAIESHKASIRPASIKSDLGVIGLVFSLVFSLLTLVVLLIINFIKWVKS